MDKLKKNLLFSLIALNVFMAFLSLAKADDVRGEEFNLLIANGDDLGFQNFPNWILILVTSGDLNSSNARCRLHTGGGYLKFTANESVTLRITYNVTTVKVAGDQGNVLRIINTGYTFPINANDDVQIIWDMPLEPWVPITFILGMAGLISLFGGALYSVNEIKKGNYREGFEYGAIYVSLGIALTLVWLWA